MAYHILCVDDEDQILAVFEEMFANTEYVLHTAKNGVDGLLAVKEHRPGLVFLDEMMPEMRGTETLKLIREVDPEIAVVIVSGRVTASKARDLLAQGAFDYLQKPIDLKHLLDLVEQWRMGQEARG